MEKASEVYLHSKRNDAMDNENIILSLSEKIIEGVKSEENQHYFYSIFFGQNFWYFQAGTASCGNISVTFIWTVKKQSRRDF